MRISQAAFDLIVAEEVTSQAVYSKKYRKPEWPGVSSGVTVGIGYDLGQTAAATIRADWKDRVPPAMLDAMASASGVTGTKAKSLTARLRDKIDIPWATALAVHKECVLPRWEAKVAKALPNTDKLSPDCFGALVSLTFNRGPSFSTKGDRYIEMRAIKAHMAAGNFAAIPNEFRAMKRIWPNMAGLRKRRDTEAKLFEKGLSGEKPTQHGQKSAEIASVQKRLDAMGYFVGNIDGKWGGKTAGGIAGFKNDRHLSGETVIDAALLDALTAAEAEGFKRPIAPERAEATEATVTKSAPEIVPVKRGRFAALLAIIGSAVGGLVNAIADYFHDALAWVITLKQYAADAPAWIWFAIAGGVALVIWFAAKNGAKGIVEAFRKGERS